MKQMASRIGSITLVCLFLSTLVPIWASISPGEPSLTPKIIDGVLAAVLAVLLITLHQLAGRSVTVEARAKSYDICKWVAVLPLVLFGIYLQGLELKWDVLLIGLGWRAWYLVTVLPLVLAMRTRDR
jgi:hypothetical protein